MSDVTEVNFRKVMAALREIVDQNNRYQSSLHSIVMELSCRTSLSESTIRRMIRTLQALKVIKTDRLAIRTLSLYSGKQLVHYLELLLPDAVIERVNGFFRLRQ